MISKKDIPVKGDVVKKVVVNKARTVGQLIFSSGKKVNIEIDPSEFNVASSPVRKESVQRTVNSLDKNTPNDQEYKNKVLETLGRMSGMTPEEIQQQIQENAPVAVQMQAAVGAGPKSDAEITEDYRMKAQAALEKSQNRATMLAEQMSAKSGGKTDRSFVGGKTTLSM